MASNNGRREVLLSGNASSVASNNGRAQVSSDMVTLTASGNSRDEGSSDVLTLTASGSYHKQVLFASAVETTKEIIRTETDSEGSTSSEGESFHEITTSEGEPYNTSDDEDEMRLQWLMEGVYYSPMKVVDKDPVHRNSLLLLDKDLLHHDDDIESTLVYIYHTSHVM